MAFVYQAQGLYAKVEPLFQESLACWHCQIIAGQHDHETGRAYVPPHSPFSRVVVYLRG
jgi:hypothetical protein